MPGNNRGRIVVVDDEAQVRTVLQLTLEKDGYRVHPFDDGSAALSFLAEQGADLVLTDILMPGIDGMELLDKVLALDEEIPVILISAFADIDTTVSAVKKGAFDFIFKPFDPEYLRKAVEKGVTFHRLRLAERDYRADLERAVEERTRELQKAHDLLRQSEKMTLLGQIAAGVAHEINTPLGFISSNLESLSKFTERLLMFFMVQSESLDKYCPADELSRIQAIRTRSHICRIVEELPEIVKDSLEGAERIKEIVKNLKSFSRADEDQFVTANINDSLLKALNIVKNELKYVATVVTELGELSPGRCLPNQLTQVFMNLLVNAAQALENRGEIRVRSWQSGGNFRVSVSDTGCGMPQEVLKHIFEPFFTTKEVGKGTGLGLAISYDIVRKHGGEIGVESAPGKGTTFTVTLPVRDTGV